MLAFICGTCQTKLHRHDSEAGSKILCPSCGQRLEVPQLFVEGELTVVTPLRTERTTPLAGSTPSPRELPNAPRFRFRCPHCQASMRIGVGMAGARVECPKCKLPFEVPVSRGELHEVMPSPSAIRPTAAAGLGQTLPSQDRGRLAETLAARTATGKGVAPEKPRSLLFWLGICCGGLVLASCGGLGLIHLMDSWGGNNSRSFAVVPSSSSTAPFTEAAAREQLKKALNIWVNNGTPQSLAQTHPDIEFADPLFTDGSDLLGYDIERADFSEVLRKCQLDVSMKYRRVDGQEGRYSRFYEVAKPDERRIWRISVSPYSPSPPRVSQAPLVTEARDVLKTVLDAWVARDWKAELARKYPAIDFVDLDYSDTKLVTRYDIGRSEGPSTNGTWTFHVFLVFLSTQQTEFRVGKSFEVDRPNERGIWHIRGYRTSP